jgi:hypothetical protein
LKNYIIIFQILIVNIIIKKNNIINLIKTLITNKIVINTDFLENEKTFNEDYMIVLEIFKLILEYDNIYDNINNNFEENEKKNIEKKLIKKFNKITLD